MLRLMCHEYCNEPREGRNPDLLAQLDAFDNFSRLNQVFSPLLMSKQTLVSLQLQTPA